MKKLMVIIFLLTVFNKANSQSITKWKTQDYINYTKNKYDTSYLIYFWSIKSYVSKEQIFLFERIFKSFPNTTMKLLLVNIDKGKTEIYAAQKFISTSKILNKVVSMDIDSVNAIVDRKSIMDKINVNQALLIFYEPFAPRLYKYPFTEFELVNTIEKLSGYKNNNSNRNRWNFDSALNRYFLSPMIDAASIYPRLELGHIPDENELLFSSKFENVFSISNGIVRSVKYYDDNTCIIKIEKNCIEYIYGNIKEPLVQPCDTIYSGQKIAKALKGYKHFETVYEKDKYSMNLYIYSPKQEIVINLSRFLKRY